MSKRKIQTAHLPPLNAPDLSAAALKRFVLPILLAIASALFSGLTTRALFATLGMAVAFVWLFLSLSPVVEWAGVGIVNKNKEYRKTIVAEGSTQLRSLIEAAQSRRERKLRLAKISIGVLACIILLIVLTAFGRLSYSRQFATERKDAFNLLSTDAFTPSEEDVKAGELTIRNKWSDDIFVRSVTCHAKSLHTARNNNLDFTSIQPLGDLRLASGGDGQSIPCIDRNAIRDSANALGRVDCADVDWSIVFTVPDQRHTEITKDIRYVLQPNHQAWEQRGVAGAPIICSHHPS